jgi:hypothetical protein
MTDFIPNDLSHLSDAEFQSLCPQGEHAPGPEPLSPAQAIVKAFDDRYELLGPFEDDWQEQCLAAALGAVADQVASSIPDDCTADVFNRQLDIRAKILAIATELMNQP